MVCKPSQHHLPRAGLRRAASLSREVRSKASRRDIVNSTLGTVAFVSLGIPPVVGADVLSASEYEATIARRVFMLEVQYRAAYAKRDFPLAVSMLSELMYLEPTNPKWIELRAQVCCDGKNFTASIMDYNEALRWTPVSDMVSRARLLAGRALALEGQENYDSALKEYQNAQSLATDAGAPADPYVMNSIGNCQASLGRWEDARNSYLESARIFQSSRGIQGVGDKQTARLDGAVFARSNAALMLAQLGDFDRATSELEYASRRGPGSVDARAALAALYFANGDVEKAEAAWNFACTSISTGCAKYRDMDWLRKVRRWPPIMVTKFDSFLTLTAAPPTV